MVVHFIALVTGTWVVKLLGFPDTSLVQLTTGQYVSQDPLVICEPVIAQQQWRMKLSPDIINSVLPVMKLHTRATDMVTMNWGAADPHGLAFLRK